jgi:hypothetical protein
MIVNEDVGAHGAAERVHRRDGIMRTTQHEKHVT